MIDNAFFSDAYRKLYAMQSELESYSAEHALDSTKVSVDYANQAINKMFDLRGTLHSMQHWMREERK